MRIVKDLPVTCEPFFRTGTGKKFSCVIQYPVLFTSSTDSDLFGYVTYTSCLHFPSDFYVKIFNGGFFYMTLRDEGINLGLTLKIALGRILRNTFYLLRASVYEPHIYNKTHKILQASIRLCSAAK